MMARVMKLEPGSTEQGPEQGGDQADRRDSSRGEFRGKSVSWVQLLSMQRREFSVSVTY